MGYIDKKELTGSMTFDEFARFKLHALYRANGYERFKMDKFEEYELYLKNRDFVETESIITFSDQTGSLMALKPDLTLSIVKSFKYEPGKVSKVFYSENVYRSSKASRMHREMMQTGLECMGDITSADSREVTVLAAKSLEVLTDDFVLQISHMGLVTDILKDVNEGSVRSDIIRCIGEKNKHDLKDVCETGGVDSKTLEALETLINVYGSCEDAESALGSLELGEEGKAAEKELIEVFDALKREGLSENARVDFSVVNDMNYYSGILFRGFADGVPVSVLSGGRYDKLMSRNSRKGGALGFAVYLDHFTRLGRKGDTPDVEVTLTVSEAKQ